MQLREILYFHSGIDKIIFLLLYKSTLLRDWLQNFRQTEGSHFQKDKVC